MKTLIPPASFGIIFFLLLFTGCAKTPGIENPTVKKAIGLQDQVLQNPLFFKILIELEEEGKVDWQDGSTQYIREDLSAYPTKVHWLQDMYLKKGPYSPEGVELWRKWNPWSSTTAATSRCENSTLLNKWKLKRDHFSISNTLIHERIHSFCMIHPEDQTRPTNQCDISYLAGDLAEVLLLRDAGITQRQMNKPVCPALLQKIEEYGLIEVLD